MSILDNVIGNELETETFEYGDMVITMTALVTADIEEARRMVKRGKISKDAVQDYLTFLSMNKAHPDVTWEEYTSPQMPTKFTTLASTVMAHVNGYDESFRILQGDGEI